MELNRSDDRIRSLIHKALRASDEAEVTGAIAELRSALKQHIQKIRDFAAAKLPLHQRRKTDRNTLETHKE